MIVGDASGLTNYNMEVTVAKRTSTTSHFE